MSASRRWLSLGRSIAKLTTQEKIMKNKSPCYVLGVGMTKFQKPRGKVEYTELGFEAGIKALADAQLNYDDIDMGVACYCYGDSTCGQRVFYQFGMTQIPIYNVNNNCSTGSTGLHLGRSMISGGLAQAVLVVGFEKMMPGSLASFYKDRASPVSNMAKMMRETRGATDAPLWPQMFGNAGREYMERFGATADDFAEIARVNHKHSKNNPYSQFRDEYTLDQVLDSPAVHSPITKLQCCPTSDGGAAAVLVSQEFLDERLHLKSQAILIAGQHLCTDSPALYSRSSIDLVGAGMTRHAARMALAEAEVSVSDIKICELHDCFSANEMVSIDALGLSEPGRAHEMVRNGDITYGGRVVINPSGGLISKGHPLGATGLAQCAELVWQLRGWANNRSVDNADAALQHNVGLGGAVVVTVYKRADGETAKRVSDEDVASNSWLGYNAAVEARGISAAQMDRVRSRTMRSAWALQEDSCKLEARM